MKTMVEYIGEAAKKELTSERLKATRINYPGGQNPFANFQPETKVTKQAKPATTVKPEAPETPETTK